MDNSTLCFLCEKEEVEEVFMEIITNNFVADILYNINTRLEIKNVLSLSMKVCDKCNKITKSLLEYLRYIIEENNKLNTICTTIEKHKTNIAALVCEKEYIKETLEIDHECTDNELNKDKCSTNIQIDATENGNNITDNDLIADNTSEESSDGEMEISKKDYNCTLCNKQFSSRKMYIEHNKKTHNPLICKYEDCRKVMPNRLAYQIHLRKHDGEKPFLCGSCGKTFYSKSSLSCHEKIHLEVKPHKCKDCNIGFALYCNLRQHEKKYHEGKRFYCSQCTKAYLTKCGLERHELVHSGVKDFQCSTCTKSFYTEREMLAHHRYHQNIRQYKCEECYKSFFQKHHLTIHIRQHSGEKPYVCKVPGCTKKYTESQKLSRHVKVAHSATKVN